MKFHMKSGDDIKVIGNTTFEQIKKIIERGDQLIYVDTKLIIFTREIEYIEFEK